jgi:hypothetical protein
VLRGWVAKASIAELVKQSEHVNHMGMLCNASQEYNEFQLIRGLPTLISSRN